MLLIYKSSPSWMFALFGPNFWYQWSASSGSDTMANSFAAQITGGTVVGATNVSTTHWDAIKAATGH